MSEGPQGQKRPADTVAATVLVAKDRHRRGRRDVESSIGQGLVRRGWGERARAEVIARGTIGGRQASGRSLEINGVRLQASGGFSV
jgi:hypothetical protein